MVIRENGMQYKQLIDGSRADWSQDLSQQALSFYPNIQQLLLLYATQNLFNIATYIKLLFSSLMH